jgi:hypothetical protein
MSAINDHRDSPARQELVPIFVSLELSRVRWLVTWTFHGSSKMSRTSGPCRNLRAKSDAKESQLFQSVIVSLSSVSH